MSVGKSSFVPVSGHSGNVSCRRSCSASPSRSRTSKFKGTNELPDAECTAIPPTAATTMESRGSPQYKISRRYDWIELNMRYASFAAGSGCEITSSYT